MNERNYPYDPGACVEELTGLDKLRAVADRDVAKLLYRLWFNLAPDTPKAEEFDPREYDPEEDMHDPAGARADQQDRACAAVHHAWQTFYAKMADYEQLHGRRLSRRQREAHEFRFGGILIKQYGISHPLASWKARYAEWSERVVGRGVAGGKNGG